MAYQHKIDGCFSSVLGAPHGLKDQALEDLRPLALDALLKFQRLYEAGILPHFTLPFSRKDLVGASSIVLKFQDEFSDIIFLGTGGSSLGGQTLSALTNCMAPRLHFADNIDPHTFSNLLSTIDPKTTGVVVTSKSGSTAETLLQFLTCMHHWRTHLSEQSFSHHFLIITEKKSSPLYRFKERYDLSFIEHDAQLGGRFSIFSLVGLFPALLVGVDAIAFRQGAASLLEQMATCSDILDFAPSVGASLSYALWKDHQKTISVMMPYADRLQFFSKWYRQLWAESLGKNGKGTTPVDALGAVDQHSQLQLYLDGPRDKFFTLLTTDMNQQGLPSLPSHLINDSDLQYLYDKRLGDLMAAEQTATIETLIKNQCPTRIIHLSEITPYALGELSMHFVLETLFMAEFLGVDPFNQPAVEQGKVLAKKYLLERA